MTSSKLYKPLISIVTVVYNSAEHIENTMQSIVNQQYSNIEYIIIDGGSTDGTLDIINKYRKHINVLISEKDDGLYDAMNKAIQQATGEYLWFINSGDELYSTNNLCKIFEDLSKTNSLPDVIYGETEIIAQNGEAIGMRRHTTPEELNWRSLRFGMKVCHQSVIVRKKIACLYDTKYKYSADFKWLIEVLKNSKQVYNSHFTLSKFMDGGLTKNSLTASLKERFAIMRKYYGLLPTIFNHIYLAMRLVFYYFKNKRF